MTRTVAQSIERRQSELRLTIAGVTTAITSCEPDLILAAAGPAARFVDTIAQPDIRLDAVWQRDEHSQPGSKVFDSGGVWQLFRRGNRLSFELSSPKFGDRPYKIADVADDFAGGVVRLRRSCFENERCLYPLEYPLDELLITNWLALGRGVELHACGVADATGDGYLFTGHSGAGKTTMARQWCGEKDVTVLSDDRIILRKIGSHIRMYGTPWHGDEPLASPKSARLTRGFLIRHAAEHALIPIGGAALVAGLFARSFPPFFNARGVDFMVSFLAEVTEQVPFYDLGFVPEASIRDFVRSPAVSTKVTQDF